MYQVRPQGNTKPQRGNTQDVLSVPYHNNKPEGAKKNENKGPGKGMSLDYAIGRKEIINLFQQAGMLNWYVSDQDAWRLILRWKKRYEGFAELFSSQDGKPAVCRATALVWVSKGRRKKAHAPSIGV